MENNNWWETVEDSVPGVRRTGFLVANVLVTELSKKERVYKSEILKKLRKTKTTWVEVSKFFKIWENANIIKGIKEGRVVYYSASSNFHIFKDMVKAMDKYVCCVSGIKPKSNC